MVRGRVIHHRNADVTARWDKVALESASKVNMQPVASFWGQSQRGMENRNSRETQMEGSDGTVLSQRVCTTWKRASPACPCGNKSWKNMAPD